MQAQLQAACMSNKQLLVPSADGLRTEMPTLTCFPSYCITKRDNGSGGSEKDERLPAILISQLAHQSEPYRPENPSNLQSESN